MSDHAAHHPDAAARPGQCDPDWQARLARLLVRLREESETYLGYPNNQALDAANLAPFLDLVINNIGDPMSGNLGINTCDFEREVIGFFAELMRLPAGEGWGYVTNGGTESNLHGYFTGRERFPGAVLIASAESHYSVAKAARLLGMRFEMVPTQPHGEIDYDALAAALARVRPDPVVINANIGTTMKGAIDDVGRILSLLRAQGIEQWHLHCDAALFGGFLPFLPAAPVFDFSLPIDSLAISGHKFLGSGIPCGVLLTRRANLERIRRRIDYIGSFDGTISGSRNGLTVLILWQTLQRLGREGLARWASQVIDNTRYTLDALAGIGWPAWANHCSNTVVIRRPPEGMTRRWHLAVTDELAHLVIMPSVTRPTIDRFVRELRLATSGG